MKYIVLFIHFLAITIYSLFFTDPVTIKTNLPESAKPGSEFTAEFIITKGSLAGFAKFQVELPVGFTARDGDSRGGSFAISGQTAKIIWTSVPGDATFTVKMTIMVDASASGDKVVQGKYSYIENNVKQQVDFSPATVKIASDATANTTTQNTEENTTGTQTTSATQNTTKEGEAVVSVIRTIIPGKSPDEYVVEIKIKKDGVTGFAKLQDKIPDGYFATGHNMDEGSFSYNSQEHAAKFIWTSLPSKEELNLSYKILPKQGVAHDKNAVLDGEFSYLETGKQKKYSIPGQELNGGSAVTTNTVEPENTNTVTTKPVTTNTTSSTEPVTTNTTSTEPFTTNTVSNEPIKTTEPVETKTITTQETTTTTTQVKNSAVQFAVQVGAFMKGVDVNALSRRFSLTGVRTEMQDGYTKCLVGNHSDYKSARNARETVKAKGVTDAFVTAHNAGKRITVQEALMITSQKWFR